MKLFLGKRAIRIIGYCTPYLRYLPTGETWKETSTDGYSVNLKAYLEGAAAVKEIFGTSVRSSDTFAMLL